MYAEGRIAEVVTMFKRNWTELFDAKWLESLFREEKVSWRERVLTPARTLQLLLLQVLHGNVSCSQLRHLSELSFSAAAYCQARMRLPVAVLTRLTGQVCERLPEEEFGKDLWRGHRIWLGDGSSVSMPDTEELRRYFGQPSGQSDGCGFPVAHVLALVHGATGMVQKMLISPFGTHDMTRAAELHEELEAGDIVVEDRGFCSYAHICLLEQREVALVFRIHQSHKVDFRESSGQVARNKHSMRRRRLKKLGRTDHLFEWQKPRVIPRWMRGEQFASLADKIVVRELRYRLDRRGFRTREVTLVTTLLDAKKYPKSAIAELYGMRWEVETNFRHLKTTMGMDVLRCTTVDGVLREMHAFWLIYNLVRLVMVEAAKRQQVSVSRISFIDALRWLRYVRDTRNYPKLIVNPHRPGRFELRVRKRRPKNYHLMNRPRRSTLGKTPADELLAA